ncbi:MAG: hypothetical protein QOH72_5016 [Solirubrobacteraceae bacterium]|nr:hypothetical protein [Solirubrobacteraceae bacterium]
MTRPTPRTVLLMSLTVSSGVVDAISFIAMGKVFTAFMTGNLVFLGLGATSAFARNGPSIVRVAVALAAFALGVFVAGRIVRRLRERSTAFSVALAGVLLAQVVFLAGWLAVSGHPAPTFTTCLTAVAALGMGIQSGAVGSLDVKAIFTTAATATLINLSREAADPGVSETQPLQLAAILVCLVLGASVGGFLLVHARPYAPVVPPLATAVSIAASVAERRTLRRPAAVPSRSMAA